ncbi:MAG: hypothetical protein ACJAZ2_002397 [Glaciecola sp.]|jgi:hypothetical protein
MKKNFVIIVVSLLLFSCKKDKEITTEEEVVVEVDYGHEIVSADINGAKTLLLIKELVNDEMEWVIYKTTSSNTLEAVTITTDASSGAAGRGVITVVYDVNDRYFYLSGRNFEHTHYFIDKTNGKAYPFDGATFIYTPRWDWHQYGDFVEDIFASDDEGNIYFNSENKVLRVNISNPNNITSEVASFDQDHVSDFSIDHKGNLTYSGEYNGSRILRAISRDKSTLQQLPGSTNRSWNYRFRGADGNLYYDYDGITAINFAPFETLNYTDASTNAGCGYRLVTVKNKNATIGVGRCSGIFHLDHDNASLEMIAPWGISDVIAVRANNDHYFVAYKSGSTVKLSMADPADNVPEDLISAQYEVSGFDVTKDGDVFFSALDNQNLKTVIGKVTSSGSITVLKEGINTDIVFLAITNL